MLSNGVLSGNADHEPFFQAISMRTMKQRNDVCLLKILTKYSDICAESDDTIKMAKLLHCLNASCRWYTYRRDRDCILMVWCWFFHLLSFILPTDTSANFLSLDTNTRAKKPSSQNPNALLGKDTIDDQPKGEHIIGKSNPCFLYLPHTAFQYNTLKDFISTFNAKFTFRFVCFLENMNLHTVFVGDKLE